MMKNVLRFALGRQRFSTSAAAAAATAFPGRSNRERLIPSRHSRKVLPQVCTDLDTLHYLTDDVLQAPMGSLFTYAVDKDSQLDAWDAADVARQKVEFLVRGYAAQLPGTMWHRWAVGADKKTSQFVIDPEDTEKVSQTLKQMEDLLDRIWNEGHAYMLVRADRMQEKAEKEGLQNKEEEETVYLWRGTSIPDHKQLEAEMKETKKRYDMDSDSDTEYKGEKYDGVQYDIYVHGQKPGKSDEDSDEDSDDEFDEELDSEDFEELYGKKDNEDYVSGRDSDEYSSAKGNVMEQGAIGQGGEGDIDKRLEEFFGPKGPVPMSKEERSKYFSEEDMKELKEALQARPLQEDDFVNEDDKDETPFMNDFALPGPSIDMFHSILDAMACHPNSEYVNVMKVHMLFECILQRHLADGGDKKNAQPHTAMSVMSYNAPIRVVAAMPYDNKNKLIRDHALLVAFKAYDGLTHAKRFERNSATFTYLLQTIAKYMPTSRHKGNIAAAMFYAAQQQGCVSESVLSAYRLANTPSNGAEFEAWKLSGHGKALVDLPLSWRCNVSKREHKAQDGIY